MATGFYMEENLSDLNLFITKPFTSLRGQTSCTYYLTSTLVNWCCSWPSMEPLLPCPFNLVCSYTLGLLPNVLW